MMQFLEDDQWRVLLLGFNKAYLVRKAHKPAYARHFSRVLSALKDKLGNFRYWDDVPFKNYQVIATAGSVDSLRKASQLHESSGKLVPVCLPQHAETRAANHATQSQKLPFLGTFLDSVSHKNSFCEKRRMRAYQKEILEGGRLEILSPITGANTVAEASVLLPNGSIGYRFGGDKGFWIIADELRFGYPLCALVLEETDEVFPVSQCNQKVLATVSSNLGLLRAGLAEPKPAASEQPPRSKLVIGDVNFAHHLWNELSGLADWAACANSSALERMTVYPLHEPLAAIETLVPALREAEVVRGEAQVRNVNSAPGIATRVGSTLVSSEIRKQVISVLSQSADQTILAHFDGFLRKYPLFWVSVRPEKRTCVNQLEFLSALIGSLLSEFPGSGIMVDGFSLPNDYPENPEYSNKKAFFENKVSSSADFIRELFRNLELNYFNEVHERVRSISGLRLAETLTLAGRVHFYVSHAGTSQHKVAWVHDKIGVVHSCRAGLSQAARKWVADQVEGGIEPIMLSPNRVLDHISRDASSLEHHNLDYLIRDVPAAVTDIIRAARSALAAQSTARELDRS
jgi:hypothetical protein